MGGGKTYRLARFCPPPPSFLPPPFLALSGIGNVYREQKRHMQKFSTFGTTKDQSKKGLPLPLGARGLRDQIQKWAL